MSESESKILVVDDEPNLAEGIIENLRAEGYQVGYAEDGIKGLASATEEPWDLIILDVMMPGLDGFAVCEALRAESNQVPVLFLTAKDETDDRVQGLAAGGDDYLTKPFDLRELLLRVQAILRRGRWYAEVPESATLKFAGNEISWRSYHAPSHDGRQHDLTHKEAMILKCLSDREGEIVSREEILETVWGYEAFPSTRTIDNFIV
ncbi:MAG: response regulator transcription factor, partial [Planctomycetes bacterium]|nr:response regulator transcription factor [Planctomycetota bacterium]